MNAYEITPEPEPDEAAAIVQALEAVLAEETPPEGGLSAWRVAAAHEAVDDGLD
jgi:hypothetical protein